MARARTLTLNTKVNVTGADKLRGLGDSLQNTGKKLTVGVTLPLLALGAGMTKLAVEAEQSRARLDSAFTSMGAGAWTTTEALEATAQSLQEMTTFGDEEIRDLQAVLLTFGNVTGDAFDKATVAALDMSAALGTDTQSAAIQLGKALNDPIQGMAALSRVGVSFTQQQKDQIRVLQESGDLLGAQTIILGELENQFGGTAEAMAGTAGGQMKQAMNALADAGEAFGEVIIPVLADAAKALKGFADFLKGLNPDVRRAIVLFGAFAAALGPVLFVTGSLIKAFVGLRAAFVGLKAGATVLIGLAPKIGLAFTAMTGPIGIAVAALGALGAAFATDFLGVRTAIVGAVEGIDDVLTDVSDSIRGFFGVVREEAPKAARIYTDAQLEMLNSTEHAWSSIHSMYDKEMPKLVDTVAEGVNAAADELGELPQKGADALLAEQFHLTDAVDELVRFMDKALDPAEEMFNARMFLASKAAADGLASGNPLVVAKTQEMIDRANAVLSGASGAAFGYGQLWSSNFAFGITANQWQIQSAAAGAAQVARNIMPSSEPKDPRSPFRGITKAFGFGDILARGILKGKRDVQNAMRALLGDGLTMPSLNAAPRLAVAGVPAAAGGSPVYVQNITVNVEGRPLDGSVDELVRTIRAATRVTEWND